MRARKWLLAGVFVLVVLMLAVTLTLLPFNLRNERVQQATIAALVVGAGWFIGFMLREMGQLLDRSERLRDVHRALFAEIQHNVRNLGTEAGLQEFGQDMAAKIADGDGFVPFIPRERNDAVFQAIIADIHILPRATIDPVVQYYSQLAALDALAEDMRGEGFRAMSPQRRAGLYRDYIALKLSALDYGREAMETIDAFAHGGEARAKTVSDRFRAERAQ